MKDLLKRVREFYKNVGEIKLIVPSAEKIGEFKEVNFSDMCAPRREIDNEIRIEVSRTQRPENEAVFSIIKSRLPGGPDFPKEQPEDCGQLASFRYKLYKLGVHDAAMQQFVIQSLADIVNSKEHPAIVYTRIIDKIKKNNGIWITALNDISNNAIVYHDRTKIYVIKAMFDCRIKMGYTAKDAQTLVKHDHLAVHRFVSEYYQRCGIADADSEYLHYVSYGTLVAIIAKQLITSGACDHTSYELDWVDKVSSILLS